jgi:UDP-N-acetylmuramyl tripeptide synthase
MVRNIAAIIVSKIAFFLIKFLSIGSGSTWPGEIAMMLNPRFISDILTSSPIKVILVAGTNGKTTTATLLKSILGYQGKKVIHNEEGANLLNGIASCLVKNAHIFGRLNCQFAIFEVDENTLPLALKVYTPDAMVLLNLFRDQLDRYGEVNTIAHKWHKALRNLPAKVKLFLNADDPQIRYLAEDLNTNVHYFGLDKKRMKKSQLSHDVDSIYCPCCGTKLDYEAISYSHLGNYRCKSCGFNRGMPYTFDDWTIHPKVKGIYNQYNISAAILVSKVLCSFPKKDVIESIENFSPAFGRQEKMNVNKREITILLSKNPTGFNQSIDTVGEILSGKKSNMLLILNDRIPDGRDVSWIWDVDFENLFSSANTIFVSGDRAYDLALRLFYAGFSTQKTEVFGEDIKKAVIQTMDSTPEGKQIIILATYSAMLEVRQALAGRKFL